MSEHLDELIKSLSSGISRRKALSRFGLGATGAALTSVRIRPDTAEAARPSRACLEACRQRPPGQSRGQCMKNCTIVNGTAIVP
jgi:hypothetical protein